MSGNSVIQIESEFKALIPPLSKEEYQQLEFDPPVGPYLHCPFAGGRSACLGWSALDVRPPGCLAGDLLRILLLDFSVFYAATLVCLYTLALQPRPFNPGSPKRKPLYMS